MIDDSNLIEDTGFLMLDFHLLFFDRWFAIRESGNVVKKFESNWDLILQIFAAVSKIWMEENCRIPDYNFDKYRCFYDSAIIGYENP